MRSINPAPILFALVLGLAISTAAPVEAEAGPDTIHTSGQLWTTANANYKGWMKNVEVVFLDGTGAIVESFSAPDFYVDSGKFDFSFEADHSDWDNAVLNSATISIESDQVVEEFDYATDTYLASYFLLEKGTTVTTGGIWSQDHGGSEPNW